jgi:diguanylate cyclase (GGDEF)-like protein
LQYLAQYDALTRLPNRRLFHDRLDSALVRAARHPGVFSLLYLDLDKFKQVNDLHGHAAGDLLLHEMGRRLSGCVRAADTAARIGGDEFVVLLEGVESPEDATRVAEKIRDALSLPVNVGNLTLRTIPSIGIAMYPQHGESAQQLLKYADDAMYQVKRRRADSGRL